MMFVSRDLRQWACLMTMAGKPSKAGKSSVVNTRQEALLLQITLKCATKHQIKLQSSFTGGKEFTTKPLNIFVCSLFTKYIARINQKG